MFSLSLRAGLPSDLPAMYALDLLCFEEPFSFDLRSMRRFSTQPGAIVLLAEADIEIDTRLLGFIILQLTGPTDHRNAYIITLDVHPSARRQGIARTLISDAEHHAATAGAISIHLHVSTRNLPAIAFYQRLGYSARAHHPNFYASHLDAWSYRKSLTRSSPSTP